MNRINFLSKFPSTSKKNLFKKGSYLHYTYAISYDKAVEETLESLYDAFDTKVINSAAFARPGMDVMLSSGVLTLKCCSEKTIVINKQPPNLQLWFSSPVSGPRRFDWIPIQNPVSNTKVTQPIQFTHGAVSPSNQDKLFSFNQNNISPTTLQNNKIQCLHQQGTHPIWQWICHRDNMTPLIDLLESDLSAIFEKPVYLFNSGNGSVFRNEPLS